MRRASVLALCALLGGCSVAPPVQPYMGVGRPLLNNLARQGTAQPDRAVKGYLDFIHGQAEFDQDFDYYLKTYGEDLKAVSEDKSIAEAPINGHFYIYNERVAAMAQAYFGLARAYLEQGDLIRAERAAMSGGSLADMRAWEKLVALEAQREQWALLSEIYKRAKLKKPMLVSQHRKDFFQDQLLKTDPPDAHKKYLEEAKKARLQLTEEEAFILSANQRRSAAVAGAMLAATGAALSAAQTWSDTTYGKTAVSDSNRLQAENFVNMGLAMSGRFGEYAALGCALTGASVMQALSNPKAGAKPMELVKDFSQRAQKMGLSDNILVKFSDASTKSASVLDSARKDGNPENIKSAVESFIPAYNKLAAHLQKGKEKGLRDAKAGEAGKQ